MNPEATIHRTIRSEVPLSAVMRTKKFDLVKASLSPGWMQVMRGEPVKPETEEYGVSSFIYRRRYPFHPARLHALLDKKEPLPGVVRSKGFCWLAHFNDYMFDWGSAGVLYSIEPSMPWFAVMPPDEWGVTNPKDVFADFEGTDGDRRQEIVIIGHGMKEDVITALLDSALMKPDVDSPISDDFVDPWDFDAFFAADDDDDDDDDDSSNKQTMQDDHPQSTKCDLIH